MRPPLAAGWLHVVAEQVVFSLKSVWSDGAYQLCTVPRRAAGETGGAGGVGCGHWWGWADPRPAPAQAGVGGQPGVGHWRDRMSRLWGPHEDRCRRHCPRLHREIPGNTWMGSGCRRAPRPSRLHGLGRSRSSSWMEPGASQTWLRCARQRGARRGRVPGRIGMAALPRAQDAPCPMSCRVGRAASLRTGKSAWEAGRWPSSVV